MIFMFQALCISEQDSHELMGVYSLVGDTRHQIIVQIIVASTTKRQWDSVRKIQSDQLGVEDVRDGTDV